MKPPRTLRRQFFAVFLAALTISHIFTSRARASSALVETGAHVYEDLEYIAARGLAPSLFLGIAPLSLEYVEKTAEEARKTADERGALSLNELSALNRIENFVKNAGREEGTTPVLSSLSSEYVYLDEEDYKYPGHGIEAVQKPLSYNENGRSFGKQTLLLKPTFGWHVWGIHLHASPLLTVKLSEPSDENLTLERGYLYFGSPVALQVGKDNKWWGQGRHGTILLTNNVEAIPLVSIRTSRPISLPLLGMVAFDSLLGRLSAHREFPHAYIFGAKVSLKPATWIEFGLERAGTFGGHGAPQFDLEDFLRVFVLTRSDKNENKSNQIAGFDLRVHVFPIGTDLYWERAGEHHFSHFPFSGGEANLWGIFVSDLLGFSLRGEYFDSTNEGPVWYRHGIFTSGYTYKGKVLGHHAGGDSKDLYFEVSRPLLKNAKLKLSFDLERRGESLENAESRRQFGSGVSIYAKNARISIYGAYEKVNNLDFTAGKSDYNVYFSVSVEYDFY